MYRRLLSVEDILWLLFWVLILSTSSTLKCFLDSWDLDMRCLMYERLRNKNIGWKNFAVSNQFTLYTCNARMYDCKIKCMTVTKQKLIHTFESKKCDWKAQHWVLQFCIVCRISQMVKNHIFTSIVHVTWASLFFISQFKVKARTIKTHQYLVPCAQEAVNLSGLWKQTTFFLF